MRREGKRSQRPPRAPVPETRAQFDARQAALMAAAVRRERARLDRLDASYRRDAEREAPPGWDGGLSQPIYGWMRPR